MEATKKMFIQRNDLLSKTIIQQNIPTINNVNQLYDEALNEFKCAMGVVNGICYVVMADAIDKLKKTPLFKREAKKSLNMALKAYKDYEHALLWGTFNDHFFFEPLKPTKERLLKGYKEITRQQLFYSWQDIGAFAYDRCKSHIEMLRIQMWQALTTHEVEYREEISYYLLAQTLLDYARVIYYQLCHDIKEETRIDYTDIFHDFCLEGVYKQWKLASHYIGKSIDPDKVVNLNQYDNIRTAFHAFENSILHDIRYSISVNEAIVDNKDMLSKKEFREYTLNYQSALEDYQKKKNAHQKD